MNRPFVLGLLSLALAAATHGCGARPPAQSPRASADRQTNVLVFAAASTADALDEIKEQYARMAAGQVQTSYAGSSTLARQIAQGADADLFLSADTEWSDYLARKDLVVRRQNLLGNRLAIIVPAGSGASVTRPEDLLAADVEHLALGEPDSVPAGRYAKQALTRLGLWDRLQAKVVPAEDVRHALAYVESGAAEAGIVYATDAAVSKKVRVAAELPENLTEPIRYPLALLKHGEHNAAAESFYRYLFSAEATEIFRKHGFTVLTEAEAHRE